MYEKRKQAYIEALVNLIKKNPPGGSGYIDAFREAATERGEEKLIAPVLAEVKRLLSDEEGKSATVFFGHRDEKSEKEAREALQDLTIEESDAVFAEDTNLIGGYRIETKNMLVDASFKGALLSLYKRITG